MFQLKYIGKIVSAINIIGTKLDQAIPTNHKLNTFTEITEAKIQNRAVNAVKIPKALCSPWLTSTKKLLC